MGFKTLLFFYLEFLKEKKNTVEAGLSCTSRTNVFPAIAVFRMLDGLVKVKFTLEQAMKAQRGSRGIALLFL
jgi:hypothetical protein